LRENLDRLRMTTLDSAERTQDTLLNLNDALQAIAGRLTRLESTDAIPPARLAAQPAMADHLDEPMPAPRGGLHREEPQLVDRFGDERTADEADLTDDLAPLAAPSAAPSVDMTEDTRPLEPGTGRPDKMAPAAKAPRAAAEPQDEELTGRDRKADFIAAARRAAQAAAEDTHGGVDGAPGKSRRWFKRSRRKAEPQAAIEPSVPIEPALHAADEDDIYATPLAGSSLPPRHDSTGGLGGILKKHKRPLMIAASGLVAIFLAIQAGKIFLGAPSDQVAIDQTMQEATDLPAKADAESVTNEAPAEDSDNAAPGAIAPHSAAPVEMDAPATADAAESPEAPASAAPSAPVTVTDTEPMTTDPTSTNTTSAPITDANLSMPPAGLGPLALRQAAATGDPEAQFEVAVRFTEGRGVNPNLTPVSYTHLRRPRCGTSAPPRPGSPRRNIASAASMKRAPACARISTRRATGIIAPPSPEIPRRCTSSPSSMPRASAARRTSPPPRSGSTRPPRPASATANTISAFSMPAASASRRT